MRLLSATLCLGNVAFRSAAGPSGQVSLQVSSCRGATSLALPHTLTLTHTLTLPHTLTSPHSLTFPHSLTLPHTLGRARAAWSPSRRRCMLWRSCWGSRRRVRM